MSTEDEGELADFHSNPELQQIKSDLAMVSSHRLDADYASEDSDNNDNEVAFKGLMEERSIWTGSKTSVNIQVDRMATAAFLDIVMDGHIQKQLNSKIRKTKIWRMVAERMLGKGIPLDEETAVEKCRNKYKNLERHYKDYIQKPSDSGTGRRKAPYFLKELHQLFGEKHAIKSPVVVGSLFSYNSKNSNAPAENLLPASSGLSRSLASVCHSPTGTFAPAVSVLHPREQTSRAKPVLPLADEFAAGSPIASEGHTVPKGTVAVKKKGGTAVQILETLKGIRTELTEARKQNAEFMQSLLDTLEENRELDELRYKESLKRQEWQEEKIRKARDIQFQQLLAVFKENANNQRAILEAITKNSANS